MDESQDIKQLVSALIAALPAPVRNAIASSEIEQNLRELANKHKLHLDQWDSLEQEVMFTLLGVHPVEELELNIMGEVGIPLDAAHALADDISATIFEPIRQELERQLEHPEAKTATTTATEAAGAQALEAARAEEGTQPTPETTPAAPTTPPTPAVQPATPPAPTPDVKVTRPSDSTAYKPGEASVARKSVGDDPYRESIS